MRGCDALSSYRPPRGLCEVWADVVDKGTVILLAPQDQPLLAGAVHGDSPYSGSVVTPLADAATMPVVLDVVQYVVHSFVQFDEAVVGAQGNELPVCLGTEQKCAHQP